MEPRESGGEDNDGSSFDIASALLSLSIGNSVAQQPSTNPTSTQYTTPQKTVQEQVPVDLGQAPFTPKQENEPESSREFSTRNSATLDNTCLAILQDACALHKFSRSVRQKDLETIVERPQRTSAAILGIINAKARFDNASRTSLDIIHSQRSGNLGDVAVEDVHGLIYPQDLLRAARQVEEKLSKGELEISEDLPYGDLYLAPRSIEALNGCLGAVYDGMDALFKNYTDSSLNPQCGLGRSRRNYDSVHVCIRPPGHHAAEASPCGFCWINNVHIAIAYARRNYGVKRAAILDFDLHHGDGSQSIAWSINETSPSAIGYFSLHDIYSFPCETGNVDKIREASVTISAHGHNIYNVAMEAYKDADDFDRLYRDKYSKLFEAAEKYLAEGFANGEKSVVCISAGYDASEHESASMQRHAISVPTSFYERFTRDAVTLAQKYCQNKVFSVMEGGYGDRAIVSAASAHMIGLVQASISDETISACYGSKALDILSKNYLRKARKGRDSGIADGVRDPWLARIDTLRAKHLMPPVIQASKVSPDASVLVDLQRMTLRDRKTRTTPVATPRSVRATPRATPLRHSNETQTSPRKAKVVEAATNQAMVHHATSDLGHSSQQNQREVSESGIPLFREPLLKPVLLKQSSPEPMLSMSKVDSTPSIYDFPED